MAALSIYKASAGSGKTFALTLAYMKLLFRYPEAYRHILAVTFTNKAAGEMKRRILERLHALSRASENDELQDLQILMEETGLDGAELIRRSGDLLRRMLNDYSAFSVGTIDKFFQSVIRAFTREIGIQPAYNLELDHQRVMEEAVDELFRGLGDDPGLHGWMSAFMNSRMDEALSWNFRREVEELGKHLFRESFQQLYSDTSMDLLGRESLEIFRKELSGTAQSCEEGLRNLGRKALDLLGEYELQPEDLKGAGHSPAQVFALAALEGKARFTDGQRRALAEADRWIKKSDPPFMEELVREKLMPMLLEVQELERVQNTVRLIQSNFYTLGILSDISSRVLQIVREKNIFLLADSSRFLRGIIRGNPVPFIYEKTGLRYQHIMLDEFQDTSVFQYENFRPLLDNALAGGNENLVVGDVKQSIYRWRNSDWMILASELEKDFKHQETRHVHLDRNFRSRENIIRFNNTVFQLAPGQLSRLSGAENGSFGPAYEGAVQQLPGGEKSRGGYVKMELFRKDEDQSFRDQVLERIPGWIDEILECGLEPGDIAILVRSQKDGVRVARKLLEHARITGRYNRYRLISSESLLIGQNASVSLILAAMRYLVQPFDRINLALLKFRCWKQDHGQDEPASSLFFDNLPSGEVLPAAFTEREGDLRQMPLFELTEALVGIFGLDGNQDDLPYVQAFQDLVIEYQRKDATGIGHFLKTWDQQGNTKGIRISEEANAIRILTIHRAKGLEFKAVILPFCNWEITTGHGHSNILWCNTTGTPFERIPTVPVRFSADLERSLFSEAYLDERMRGYLDNLNLLYVALTRAEDFLYIGLPEAVDDRVRGVGDLLYSLIDLEARDEPCLRSLSAYKENDCVVVGDRSEITEKKPKAKDPEWQLGMHAHYPEGQHLKLRIKENPVTTRDPALLSGRAYGEIMHRLFSEIRYANEVDAVVQSYVKKGLIPEEGAYRLGQRISKLLDDPDAGLWFREKKGRRILNERSLVTGSGEVLRPDRVVLDGEQATVIDFKFGELEHDRYREQVRAYMMQMQQMDYKPVHGYLWYVLLGHVEKVELI